MSEFSVETRRLDEIIAEYDDGLTGDSLVDLGQWNIADLWEVLHIVDNVIVERGNMAVDNLEQG